MTIYRTSRAVFAALVGVVAGITFVRYDDWFTQVAGAASGCLVMLFANSLVGFFSRYFKNIFHRNYHSLRPEDERWDDYDQRAYRIERVFLDDGKPW